MHEFQPEAPAERVYDDEAQKKIISLAAQLQREAGQSMSLNELESVAMEAGIDPRFVRQAALAHEPVTSSELPAVEDSPGRILAKVLVALALTVVQCGVVWVLLASREPELAMAVGALVAVCMGVMAASFRRYSRLAALMPFAATFLSVVVMAVGESQVLRWGSWSTLWLFVAAQGAVACGMAALVPRLVRPVDRPSKTMTQG